MFSSFSRSFSFGRKRRIIAPPGIINFTNFTFTSGGGGGSYNAGANQVALGGADGNYGGGSVYIELL